MGSCRCIKLYACLIIIFFISYVNVSAQLSRPGKPYPLNYNTFRINIREIVISQAERQKAALREDSGFLKPASTGLLIELEDTPENSGIWETRQDGTRLWRSAYSVDDAKTMSLILSPYRIVPGVKVFIYDPGQNTIAGAFTDANNRSTDVLATSQIPGNTILIEMQVPPYCENYGSIRISGIGCDFAEQPFKFVKDGWFGDSGPCNEDIACSSDPLVETIKKSVVRIVFRGHERCTGTLINKVKNEGANYVLTAGHCFKRESDANTAVFYFQYESPVCNGSDGNATRSLSGATIRARSSNVDFALLELFEPVPASYQPYYAGWDRSGTVPQSGTVIHHPLGDVKKIALDTDPLTISSFGSLYDVQSHFLASDWETGTTEPGSSGAPLFDQTGKVTGTLTGGLATCDDPINDYFQMFSHSWNDYPEDESQLAVWLDPLNTRTTVLEGYDPYAELWATGDTLSNIGDTEELTNGNSGLEWGSHAGHNNLQSTEFAEKFESSSGKMVFGLLLDVNRNYISRNSHVLYIRLWNGVEHPEELIYEKTVQLTDISAGEINFIALDTIVPVNNQFFSGYAIEYYTPADTFSTFMAQRPKGPNTAYVFNGNEWSPLNIFTGGLIASNSFGIYPIVYDRPDREPDVMQDGEIMVYPNPANDFFRVVFREIQTEPVKLSISNMQGQVLLKKDLGAFQHIIPVELTGIPAGVYVIRADVGVKHYRAKVAVVK